MTRAQKPGVWMGEQPLILASRSAARRQLLEVIGLAPELAAPEIDERAVEAEERARGAAPQILARRLAGEKARAVSQRYPSRYVLGADQILDLDGRPLAKSPDLAAARDRLRELAGRSHRLISACAIARGGALVFEAVEVAELHMRALSGTEIDDYLAIVGDDVLSSVGAYQIEGVGRLLFEDVNADQAVILGLPVAGLCRYLRRAGLTRL